MFRKSVLVLGAFIVILPLNASPALAATDSCNLGVEVTFREGAPVDKFTVENKSSAWQVSNMEIDLKSSKGRLIFDTTSGGKGVEVFQPYKSVSGSAKVTKASFVADGADSISIAFEKFSKGQAFTFSIDVDDQLTASDLGQIRVTGGEMENAKANFILKNSDGKTIKAQASFGKNNKAILKMPNCNT